MRHGPVRSVMTELIKLVSLKKIKIRGFIAEGVIISIHHIYRYLCPGVIIHVIIIIISKKKKLKKSILLLSMTSVRVVIAVFAINSTAGTRFLVLLSLDFMLGDWLPFRRLS